MRTTSVDLHEELADVYRQFPYATVDTSRTRALWAEIERLERVEGVEG